MRRSEHRLEKLKVQVESDITGAIRRDKYSQRRELLWDLLVRCYDRACFAIPDVANVPEEQQGEVVSALLTVAERVLRDSTGQFDRALFAQHCQSAASVSNVPFLQGVFLGMLTELRVTDPTMLAAEIA